MSGRAERERRTLGGRPGWCALALAGALAAGSAQAQQIPPRETGTAIVRARLIDEQLELRDLATNTPLIVTRGMKLASPLDPLIKVNIALQEQPTGADIIVTYTNTTDVRSPLGMLSLGVITLGSDISYMDTRTNCDFITANAATFIGQAWGYPDHAYSPVWVLSNSSYSIGVSLQYPILEYQHDVKMWIDNPRGKYLTGEGGRGWSVNFGLSATGGYFWETVHRPAWLQPGETRTYVMSVRVTKTPSDWMRTLLPYRDYFRALYGGVRYRRDTTPVLGVGLSDKTLISDSNPRGFAPEFRPDLNGWSKFSHYLRDSFPGWSTYMVWIPSGLYRYNQAGNFPPQMCTPWLETPTLSTVFDPTQGLPAVAKSGRVLGLWWGRCCQVSPAGWDPPYLVEFDPVRGDHVNAQMAEMDLAVKAGARLVGLDTCDTAVTPVWKLYPWIEFLRLRYPDVRFVQEPRCCDVMHTLSATFISAWQETTPPATQEDLYLLKHPQWLADFLLPGHETWAGYRYNALRQYYGVQPDAPRVAADMQRHADMGFVPCMMTIPAAIARPVVAVADSWDQTVPSDIRLSAQPVPFGDVRAGSSNTALGTSAHPRASGAPNGPDVRGWKPSRPGAVVVASPVASPALNGDSPVATADAPAPENPATGRGLKKLVVRRSGALRRPDPVVDPQADDASPGVVTFYGPPSPDSRAPVVVPPSPRK